MSRLLIATSRLPVAIEIQRNHVAVNPVTEGLAASLRQMSVGRETLWFGWPGNLTRVPPELRGEMERHLAALGAVPMYMSPGEADRYLNEFCTGVLWPVFHYLVDQLPHRMQHWEVYQRTNERFAALIASRYAPGDQIWIHGLHLMLLPRLLRQKLPGARIGFFLHMPFPPAEVFCFLPWAPLLLQGVLGADLIGFQIPSYLEHFRDALRTVPGCRVEGERASIEGRAVRLGAFPIGVDARVLSALAEYPSVASEAAEIRRSAGAQHLLLGIDPLHQSMGLVRRLMALEDLLAQEPGLRGKLRLIQVVTTSRDGRVALRRQIDEAVGRVNSAFGGPDWTPVIHMYDAPSMRREVALYRAADVLLATPLRDGMNMTSKEFVASRTDEDGVLVLSRFAGAAQELTEALQVNPYDVEGTASSIRAAIQMPAAERQARMQALREKVMRRDIQSWVSDFLAQLDSPAA